MGNWAVNQKGLSLSLSLSRGLPVQVVVVPQPAGTSAAVIADAAPRLSTENITILSRLAQNRLTQQVGLHPCETLQ